jgi:hypothetical protein
LRRTATGRKIRRIDFNRNRTFIREKKWKTLPLYDRPEYKNSVLTTKTWEKVERTM